MAIESLEEAVSYLEALINVEGRLGEGIDRDGLGAMSDLMDALGHPERSAPSLHVAGSKGKGSVVLFVEALLSALGERVGAYTSPHLSRWTERYRVDGGEVDGAAFATAVRAVQPFVDAARSDHPGRAPSFFDAATAAGFLLFREARVDRVVAEVGLGGRLDATNVLLPEVTCITHLELEHTDRLGATLAEIAVEKGGILKPGVPCVLGELAPEAREVIAKLASERDVPLFEFGRDFTVAAEVCSDPLRGCDLAYGDVNGLNVSTRVGPPGLHQARNAALAIACVARLRSFSTDAVRSAAEQALPTCVLPGRLDVLRREPLSLVDAAHTPESARALADFLATLPSAKTHVVVSISAGKRTPEILRPLLSVLPPGSELTVTRADPHRSLDPSEIRTAIDLIEGRKGRLEVRVVPNPHLALRAARESVGDGERLLATGSVYLAGIAREVWGEASPAKVAVSRRNAAKGGTT